MLTEMGEVLKTIGSFAGLLSAAFLIYDRFAKGRPVASLTISQENKRPSPRIRVSNPGSFDVAVLSTSVEPNVYLLAENEGAEGNLRASFGQIPNFMLKPGQEKELRIVPRFENNLPLDLKPQDVTFRIYWRRGNSTWLRQMPVRVVVNTDLIRQYGLPKPDVLI
jgi:hypothetical protein